MKYMVLHRSRARAFGLGDVPEGVLDIITGLLPTCSIRTLRLVSRTLRSAASRKLSRITYDDLNTYTFEATYSEAILARLSALQPHFRLPSLRLPIDRPLQIVETSLNPGDVFLAPDAAPHVTRLVAKRLVHGHEAAPEEVPGIEQVLARLPALASLQLLGIDERTLGQLPQLSRLTHLELRARMPENLLPQLAKLTTLRSLRVPDLRIEYDLQVNPRVREELVLMVGAGAFPQLTSLEVCSGARGTAALGNLTGLSCLTCMLVNGDLGPLKPLTALSRLRELKLQYFRPVWRAASPDWHCLAALTSLTSLRLQFATFSLDDAGLSALAALTWLRDLSLRTLSGPVAEPAGVTGDTGLPPALSVLAAACDLESVSLKVYGYDWAAMGAARNRAVGTALANLPRLTSLEFDLGVLWGARRDPPTADATPLLSALAGDRAAPSASPKADAADPMLCPAARRMGDWVPLPPPHAARASCLHPEPPAAAIPQPSGAACVHERRQIAHVGCPGPSHHTAKTASGNRHGLSFEP
eukprot:jgi/Botrbrau1/12882/Bobra.0299s0002.1